MTDNNFVHNPSIVIREQVNDSELCLYAAGPGVVPECYVGFHSDSQFISVKKNKNTNHRTCSRDVIRGHATTYSWRRRRSQVQKSEAWSDEKHSFNTFSPRFFTSR